MTREKLEEILERFEYPIDELKVSKGVFYYEFSTQWEAEEMIDLFTGNQGLDMDLISDENFRVNLDISNQEEDEFLML